MQVLLTLSLLLQVRVSPAIDAAVADGIRTGVFPGAVVVVGRHDTVLYAKGYGHFTWSSRSAVPHPDSTLYDLASLTKVVATTPAIMTLVQDGRIDLDRPVQDYLPGFVGAGKEAVTVGMLLSHTSGLRAFLALNQLAKDASTAQELVLTEPLRWPPGSHVEYSDLNAMLLGWIVEAVAHERLDHFVAERVFAPMGMTQTRYLPPPAWRRRIAPAGLWHGTPVAGSVHDQNAARLGGVSGHAGLYSTGLDLARYAQVLLNQGATAECRSVLAPATVARFTAHAAGDRALGWELNDTTTTDNTGSLMSPVAFGHTGFTGTSIWIDPPRDIFIILLTNRVFSTRARRPITKLKAIRARVADAAAELVGGGPRVVVAGRC